MVIAYMVQFVGRHPLDHRVDLFLDLVLNRFL